MSYAEKFLDSSFLAGLNLYVKPWAASGLVTSPWADDAVDMDEGSFAGEYLISDLTDGLDYVIFEQVGVSKTSTDPVRGQINYRIASSSNVIIRTQPVDPDTNELNPMFIGKDYVLPDNAIVFTCDEPSHFTIGEATCWFGGRSIRGDSFLVQGTISDNGDGTWDLIFQLLSSATSAFRANNFKYTVELRGPGPEKDFKITGTVDFLETYS